MTTVYLTRRELDWIPTDKVNYLTGRTEFRCAPKACILLWMWRCNAKRLKAAHEFAARENYQVIEFPVERRCPSRERQHTAEINRILGITPAQGKAVEA